MIDPSGEAQQAAFLYTPKVEAALRVEMGAVEVVQLPYGVEFTGPIIWGIPIMWVDIRNNATRIYMTAERTARRNFSVEYVHKSVMHELAHLALIRINPDLYSGGRTYGLRFVSEGFAEFVSLDYLADSYSPAVPNMGAHLARMSQNYLDSTNGSWLGKVPESLLALIGHLGSSRRPVWNQFISPYPFGYKFYRTIAEESGDDWRGKASTLERLIDVIKHPDIPLAQILRPQLYMEAHRRGSG